MGRASALDGSTEEGGFFRSTGGPPGIPPVCALARRVPIREPLCLLSTATVLGHCASYLALRTLGPWTSAQTISWHGSPAPPFPAPLPQKRSVCMPMCRVAAMRAPEIISNSSVSPLSGGRACGMDSLRENCFGSGRGPCLVRRVGESLDEGLTLPPHARQIPPRGARTSPGGARHPYNATTAPLNLTENLLKI